MSTNLIKILHFLHHCYCAYEEKRGRGRPLFYSRASMTLFFMVMSIKKIHSFKAMKSYADLHHQSFGFEKAPSRKTLRRRFLEQPKLIHRLLPEIARRCQQKDATRFRSSWCFVDKSIFRALGGLWHKKHRKQGVIPHKSIDTDASWGKSPYHQWRFGYGLHVICLQNRFPIAAAVTTASVKDYTLIEQLLEYLKGVVGVIVGDAGYQCWKIIKTLYQNTGILLQTPKQFKVYLKNEFTNWYNQIIGVPQAKWLYYKRKPSVEPFFALIKNAYELEGEKQLPYRGIDKVSAFLMIATLSMQLMMRDNFLNNRELADTKLFLSYFK